MSWTKGRIENLPLTFEDGDRGKNYPKSKDFSRNGYCVFLNTKNVLKNGFKLNEVVYINREKDTILRKGKLKRHDIVLTTRGTLGNIGYYSENIRYENIRINSGMLIIRCDNVQINPKFLYYQLRSDIFQKQISSAQSGAAQPQLPISTLKKLNLQYPNSLQTQKRIADILGAYDDLIENNLKRIKLLEQAAQNIYTEWFVHLRFPGHEETPFDEETGLPEGWEELSIKNMLSHQIGGGWGKEEMEDNYLHPAFVIRGTDFPNIEKGSLGDIPFRFHKESNLRTRKLESGDIIFEVSGGSTNVGVARSLLITDSLITSLGSDVMCASFCKLMRPLNNSYSYLLLMTLKHLKETKATEVYEKRSASNIVNYNWKAFLSDVNVAIPCEPLLTRFCTVIESNIAMQDVLRSQIGLLKEARDILLPRLMNRTIEV